MMFVLLYGRKGQFAPLIASGILPPIVFAFPGVFVQRRVQLPRLGLMCRKWHVLGSLVGVHAAVSCCHRPSALDASLAGHPCCPLHLRRRCC